MVAEKYSITFDNYERNVRHDSQWNLDESMSDWVVSSVPADGLAPLGARPSAAIGITKYASRIYTLPALVRLEILQIIFPSVTHRYKNTKYPNITIWEHFSFW